MSKKTVAIFCGGSSYEHEVSIISGIQIAQNIDRSKYEPLFVYFDKDNKTHLISPFGENKKDFLKSKRTPVDLVKRGNKLGIRSKGLLPSEKTADIVYMAFHGGTGESGQTQGLLEVCDVPFTGASSEASVLAMNKAVTKEVLKHSEIPVLPWTTVFSRDFHQDKQSVIEQVLKEFSFPLIIKPTHLGSSIGIKIVHSEVELEQQLAVATRTDTEVLVEPALSDFTEYNIAVRTNQDTLEHSPIEEPKREGEVLSFDDKYTNGGKKNGAKTQGGGMEMLDRTVPAKITEDLANTIQETATKIYRACRLSGMIRIDFMYSEGKLYCTELNPIPGSLSFYLWEATGQTFQEQITTDLEDAVYRHSQKIQIEPYDTDIVEKFIQA